MFGDPDGPIRPRRDPLDRITDNALRRTKMVLPKMTLMGFLECFDSVRAVRFSERVFNFHRPMP